MKELGMAEDQLGTRKDQLREPYLWTKIFGTFKVALDPKKLLLAAAGIVVMAVGWWLLSVIFYSVRSKPQKDDYAAKAQYQEATRKYELLERTAGPGGTLRVLPWFEDRGPNQFMQIESMFRAQGLEDSESSWTKQFLVLVEPLYKFLAPVVLLFHPDAGVWNRIFFFLVILWTLATWALFGAAITRMAAVQFARNEKIGMTEAIRFTWSRYVSFFSAPLFPLVLVAVLTLFLIIFGFFQVITVFVGDIFIAGLLWPLVILFGLIMAVVLVGLVGWPLMYSTISSEGSDSFDALSRSYSYVYQAPWHYIWYGFLAVVYGAAVVFFVGLMGSLTVYLGKWAVSQAPLASSMNREPDYLFIGAPTSFHWRDLLLEGGPAVYTRDDVKAAEARLARIDDAIAKEKLSPKKGLSQKEAVRKENAGIRPGELRPDYVNRLRLWNRIGAVMVAFWLYLIFLLVVGFAYSYFWSASAIIYLLMRRKVDDTELDEVHLEEEDMEEPYTAPTPGGAAPAAPAKPAASPNLIPSETLTMRTAGGPSSPDAGSSPIRETTGEPPPAPTGYPAGPTPTEGTSSSPMVPPAESGTNPSTPGGGHQPM
jgi:hypothetical protein